MHKFPSPAPTRPFFGLVPVSALMAKSVPASLRDGAAKGRRCDSRVEKIRSPGVWKTASCFHAVAIRRLEMYERTLDREIAHGGPSPLLQEAWDHHLRALSRNAPPGPRARQRARRRSIMSNPATVERQIQIEEACIRGGDLSVRASNCGSRKRLVPPPCAQGERGRSQERTDPFGLGVLDRRANKEGKKRVGQIHRSGGVALLLVLSTLTLLFLLGSSFSVLQSVETRLVASVSDRERARAAAESGIHAAIDAVRRQARTGWFRPDGRFAEDWRLHGPPIGTDQGTIECDGFVDRRFGERELAFYSVQVQDAESGICVNDGAEQGNDSPTSLNLARILNALGSQREIGIPDLGSRILAGRPPGGYRAESELMRAVDYDPERFRRIRPHLTLHAWKNHRVSNPVPPSGHPSVLEAYPTRYPRPLDPKGQPVYRKGHGCGRRGVAVDRPDRPWPLRFYDPRISEKKGGFPWYCAVWSLGSLNPLWIQNVSRSPVNVNTASKEVLLALLIDLEGFFLLDRCRPVPSDLSYGFTSHRYSFDPEDSARERSWPRKGSEMGYLYRTVPLVGPGSRSREGIPAIKIVEEILACRERRKSPNLPGVDYSEVPWGGAFRSWSQFGKFVDHLVQEGLVRDDRPIFWDYEMSANGRGRAVPSSRQRAIASQAIGDVLKANFNPNLHLNELNPDRVLFQLVDKTDLIVQSTEFCFVPMGVFRIQSDGFVTRLAGGSTLPFYRIQDQARAVASVRIYDARMVSVQSEFQAGEIPAGFPTRRGRSLETGPEPHAPAEWDGYVSLAPLTCRKNGFGAAISAHFVDGMDADVHPADRRARGPGRQGARNFPDPGAVEGGPYVGARHPLCRVFRDRLPPASQARYIPGDLRNDGFYADLHRGIGFTFDGAAFRKHFAASLWFKPSWGAGSTGRCRSLLLLGREDGGNYANSSRSPWGPLPFGLYFLPAHHGGTGLPGYGGPPRRAGMVWAMGIGHEVLPPGGGFAVLSPSLEGVLRPQEWCHVMVVAHARDEKTDGLPRLEMFLNGKPAGDLMAVHLKDAPSDLTPLLGRLLRIGGEISSVASDPRYPRNYPADATLDDLLVWLEKPEAGMLAAEIFRRGRYFLPRAGSTDASITLRLTQGNEGGVVLALSWTFLVPPEVRARLLARVFTGGNDSGWMEDSAWSYCGIPVEPTSPPHCQIRWEIATREPILASPILDDVTVFWEPDHHEFLEYRAE